MEILRTTVRSAAVQVPAGHDGTINGNGAVGTAVGPTSPDGPDPTVAVLDGRSQVISSPLQQARPAALIDRTDELETIRELTLSSDVRLLTLTGPAGVGKTRLALEVAAVVAPHFADGVVFVDLSAARNLSSVCQALVQSLGTTDGPAEASLPERLGAAVHDRDLLIILDNVEQVLPGASSLAELLMATSRVTLLVTSREALHLRWEHTLRIPPLALPDLQYLPPLEELAEIPSVALFLRRARVVDATFTLHQDNARSVAELCVHLDGLPLAIELAAARTILLSPQMILERLGERLSLLRWQATDLPQRQQTLRSAIAWSYDMLSPEEQTLFRRLGIFAGSFSLRAAEAIAEPLTIDPLECLASLVDKSLVQVKGRDQDYVRYVLLESMREYARERLTEAGEQEEVGRIHARYYLALAERAEPELIGSEQWLWIGRLDLAQENLRAALRWFGDHEEGELALRLAVALGSFWEVKGSIAEGIHQLDKALGQTAGADPSLRAKGLSCLGSLLIWSVGEAQDTNRSSAREGAIAVLDEAVVLARSAEDPLTLARTLTCLAGLRLQTRGWDQARDLLDEAQASWREADHPWGIATTLLFRAAVALMRGNSQHAVRLAQASLVSSREMGDDAGTKLARFVAMTAAASQGELTRAAALVRELLASGDQPQQPGLVVLCAAGVAWLLRDQADPECLARLLGAAESKHRVTDHAGRVVFPMFVAAATVTLQARLGPEAFDAARAKGRPLAFEKMSALLDRTLESVFRPAALRERAAKTAQSTVLSPREQQVLQLLTQGLTNKRIAQELNVAQSTVAYYLTSIYNKLGVDTRTHALAVAAQQGLVLLRQEA